MQRSGAFHLFVNPPRQGLYNTVDNFFIKSIRDLPHLQTLLCDSDVGYHAPSFHGPSFVYTLHGRTGLIAHMWSHSHFIHGRPGSSAITPAIPETHRPHCGALGFPNYNIRDMVRKQKQSKTQTMPDRHHVHLISDSTGETLHAMARAALAPFSDQKAEIHISVFVRSPADLQTAIDKVHAQPGLVIFTLSDLQLRRRLQDECETMNVSAVAALDPIVDALSQYFGQPPDEKPGLQHRITSQYFDRIHALDFAIAHDDGLLGDRLLQADVILTGVSRSSKTPTCIYLAYRGIKAANVPLVPKQEPDRALFDAMDRGVPVIGLTASPSRLSQIRTQRIAAIGSDKTAEYAELDQIRAEVANARLFFERYDIPIIDVTRRSIEETAAEILAHLRSKGIDLQ